MDAERRRVDADQWWQRAQLMPGRSVIGIACIECRRPLHVDEDPSEVTCVHCGCTQDSPGVTGIIAAHALELLPMETAPATDEWARAAAKGR